jgi:hypothetical protein
MKIKRMIDFRMCEIDPEYTVAKVKEVYEPSFLDKILLGEKQPVTKEYRTKQGIEWWEIPSFEKFYPDPWTKKWDRLETMRRKYEEYKEREVYIKKTEEKTTNQP